MTIGRKVLPFSRALAVALVIVVTLTAGLAVTSSPAASVGTHIHSTYAGVIGPGADVSALSVKDNPNQSGVAAGYANFAGTTATDRHATSFWFPVGAVASNQPLDISINFRGPTWAETQWWMVVQNHVTGGWETVFTNRDTTPGQWTDASVQLAYGSDYVDQWGRSRLHFFSVSTGSTISAQLDYLDVSVGSAPVAITPSQHATYDGFIGGAGVGTLTARDNLHTDNNTAGYADFIPSGTRHATSFWFNNADQAAGQPVRVDLNFRGPTWSETQWQLIAQNLTTGGWDLVFSNRNVTSTGWVTSSELLANSSDYLDQWGRIRLHWYSTAASASLPAQLDHLRVTYGPSNSSASELVGSQLGVSTGAFIDTLTVAELAADMQLIDSMGAGWVRLDVNWQHVEGTPGVYDWSEPDALISAARAEGLNVLGVLVYAPAWAINTAVPSGQAPYDQAAYAAFTAAAAARYAPQGVTHWEIWNEPNLEDFWEADANVTAYGELLRDAATAIRAQVPAAKIVTGGLGPSTDSGADEANFDLSPLTFVEQLYAGGYNDSFDYLGVHPYSFPEQPSLAASWNTFHLMGDMRNIMVANGDAAKQIWATEVGAPTGSHFRAVSPLRQSDILQEAIECAAATSWLGPLFLYQHRDQPAGSDAELEDNFGLAYEDRSPKQSFTAVQSLSTEPISQQTCPANFPG